jgi:AcrR family transcriptional regulator
MVMGRPKEHGDATRSALLSSAGALLQAEGPSALSVRRLASETGTTTRAIYALFGSKEGLLSAMYREMAEALTMLHEAVVAAPDVVAELGALCLAYRASMQRYPTLYPLMFMGAPGFTPTAEDEQYARRGLARVVQAFERGVAQGVFVGRSAELMSCELWALVHGLASLELKGALGVGVQVDQVWRDSTHSLIGAFCVPPRKQVRE